MTNPYASKGGYKKPYHGSHKLRKNERIRVPKVRVIGPDGNQLGILDTHQALTIAKNHGLDLVEVSPTAKPPVCRILDFGKYMYEEKKKAKGSKSAVVKLKETKFRVNIDEHDYLTKIRRAEAFLFKGYKVKLTLMFRGRELANKERGFDVIKRAIKDLEQIASPDVEPKLMGRNISTTLSPLPLKQRKLVFNANVDEHLDDDEEDSENP